MSAGPDVPSAGLRVTAPAPRPRAAQAEDNGAPRTLGLVAGTEILLGGTGLAFTPWHSLRGTR